MDESARYTAWNIRRGNEEEEETIYLAQADLLRCVIANPFLKLTFDEIWRTETVLALARQMYDSRDFSAMSILGDALIDAGCELDTIIQHCQDTRPHVRGCWVVDLILNLG